MIRLLILISMLLPLSLSASSKSASKDASPEATEIEIQSFDSVRPYTHLRFKNDSRNFQFLIVADRTGGNRPGVFPDALRKAELLQPEFIMSVGDLIQGYTEDIDEINRQWDEFESFFEGQEIPFFYVPGNHDLSNEVMSRVWEERFKRRYYHFRYKDVLFLCLCSDDGKRANLSQDQIDYFKQAIGENDDTRWNLVFLHRPLWIEEHYENANWTHFETLLDGKDYTVFAGHNHTYTKHLRNDRKHIILATTGGGSDLSGPNHGQFDHVAWITMTDKGPQIANLMLEGIWDEDVFTPLTGRLMNQLSNVQATPMLIGSGGKSIEEASLRFVNDENSPMDVSFQSEDHPLLTGAFSGSIQVDPYSVLDLPLPLMWPTTQTLATWPPLEVNLNTSITPGNHRRLESINSMNLAVEQVRTLAPPPAKLKLDGSLTEWVGFPFKTSNREEVEQSGHCEFALARDDDFLYLAARVFDDKVLSGDPPANRWQHDYFELRIDPRPMENRKRLTQQWDNWSAIYLASFPKAEPGPSGIYRRDDFPKSLQSLQRQTADGYEIEIAIPISYIRTRGGDPKLDLITLNVTVVDYDHPEGPEILESWQPDWHLPTVVVGGGAFYLE